MIRRLLLVALGALLALLCACFGYVIALRSYPTIDSVQILDLTLTECTVSDVQLPTLPTSDWLAEDDPGWDCSTMGNGHC